MRRDLISVYIFFPRNHEPHPVGHELYETRAALMYRGFIFGVDSRITSSVLGLSAICPSNMSGSLWS